MKMKVYLLSPCEEELRGSSKGGFSLSEELRLLGPQLRKRSPGVSVCPALSLSLLWHSLSTWKKTSVCALWLLPPVLAAELNVLGFLRCEQDIPLGKVGEGERLGGGSGLVLL